MSTPYYNADAADGGGRPVIVQGHSVTGTGLPVVVQGQHHPYTNSNQQQLLHQGHHNHNNTQAAAIHHNPHNDSEWTKGEQQPRRCRDVFWALLFYVHLGVMTIAAVKYAPAAAAQMTDDFDYDYSGGENNNRQRSLLESTADAAVSQVWATVSSSHLHLYTTETRRRWLDEDNNDNVDMTVDMQALVNVLGLCGLAGFFIATLAMIFMMNFAESLIKMALWFNILVTGVVALLALSSGVIEMALLCGIGFLFSAYYAYVVWNRIPFAAANLVTAVTAIRANLGLAFFAYTNLVVSFIWSLWWAVSVVATTYVLNECDNEGNCQRDDVNGVLMFLFLVSYFWTAQVIKNVVHVTVAGTVGTWWFLPQEASTCCSKGVRDSYLRAITTSFGSICLGSLIVALIQAVKEVIQSLREEEGGGSMLLCCAQFLLGCIESLAEYFNQWAFVFVGLYGYSFMEAGMNVMALFRNRGWTAIVADMLVDTVLLMVSLGVGVLTGLVGVFVASTMQLGQASLAIAFLLGTLIGFVMCSTLFSLVSSAVNTVIVCYAEAPAEFQQNHPQLSEQMRTSWRQAYPVECHY